MDRSLERSCLISIPTGPIESDGAGSAVLLDVIISIPTGPIESPAPDG